jgi:hypothetical protein
MYLSHKYKFLFLRTPKTASSSVCDFLIRNVDDPEAIYTPVEDADIPGTLDQALIEKYNGYRYYHFTLFQLITEKVITFEQAHEYRNIAVMRDPIDRQMSFYYFFKKWTPNHLRPGNLNEYKQMTPNGYFHGQFNAMLQQSNLLDLNGKTLGTYWLYENLEKELYKFMDELGIEIKHPLPRHKSEFRKDRPKNEFYFDKESIDKMRKAFPYDFEIYTKLKKEEYETNEGFYSENQG